MRGRKSAAAFLSCEAGEGDRPEGGGGGRGAAANERDRAAVMAGTIGLDWRRLPPPPCFALSPSPAARYRIHTSQVAGAPSGLPGEANSAGSSPGWRGT